MWRIERKIARRDPLSKIILPTLIAILEYLSFVTWSNQIARENAILCTTIRLILNTQTAFGFSSLPRVTCATSLSHTIHLDDSLRFLSFSNSFLPLSFSTVFFFCRCTGIALAAMQLRIEDDRIRLECSEDSYYTDFWKRLRRAKKPASTSHERDRSLLLSHGDSVERSRFNRSMGIKIRRCHGSGIFPRDFHEMIIGLSKEKRDYLLCTSRTAKKVRC